jgi:hypothetical protein
MTPELRAATVLAPLGNWFASNPKVVAAVASAIRDATRAAYERAAKEIACACLDKPECRHPHACCRDDVAAILALIDKEPT